MRKTPVDQSLPVAIGDPHVTAATIGDLRHGDARGHVGAVGILLMDRPWERHDGSAIEADLEYRPGRFVLDDIATDDLDANTGVGDPDSIIDRRG